MNGYDGRIDSRLGGAPAPRVTEGDIAANIVGEYYFTAQEGVAGMQALKAAHEAGLTLEYLQKFDELPRLLPITVKAHPCLSLLTVCVLITRSGFMVLGKSAPASPENFNAETGRKYAREHAVRELWGHMGYALREQLHATTPRTPIMPSVAAAAVVDDENGDDRSGVIEPPPHTTTSAALMTAAEHEAAGHVYSVVHDRWEQPAASGPQ